MSKVLQKAEESFLNSQAKQAAKRGRKNQDQIIAEAIAANTARFFSERVLSDSLEARLWDIYLTGEVEKTVKLSDGTIALVREPVQLNAISWNAFKQAVAYKRGMPTIRTDNTTKEDINFTFSVLGPSQQSIMHRPEAERKKISEGMKRTLNAQVIDSEQVSQ
jgi:hypothetical protein